MPGRKVALQWLERVSDTAIEQFLNGRRMSRREVFAMRTLSMLVPVLALAGCATPVTPMTDQEMLRKLAASSNYEVCLATTITNSRRYPGLGVLADGEAYARQLDCAPYMPAIMADKQARAQARMAEAQDRAARAAAWQAWSNSLNPPSTSMNCTTTNLGGGMGTINCH